MTIQALPHTTVRALGATQVLTDPAAVVKELIDNALDAHATSIAIEIHNNTLDIIQVRDNGHGIAPDDRPLVARRYCTSKLTKFHNLQYIGGSSLGFRGEALASAAELSGSLTITTRIEGEQVASALKIDQSGEVIGQDRASLPVGTTVKITDFIKANPVRRQVILKHTETYLKKIKHTLQSYALARPRIRFSLRVLKAKNDKNDWVYAPKVNGNAEDAAFKIVGAACASQCTLSVVEHKGFTFQAFMPRPDADPNKIRNTGSFLSIDGRPVSSTKGTLKQVVKEFRDALKKASPTLEDVVDPFLALEMNCPKGSYDVNLEPAKNDVLFENASVFMEGIKKLFSAQQHAIEERSAKVAERVESAELFDELPEGFDALLERTAPPRAAVQESYDARNGARTPLPGHQCSVELEHIESADARNPSRARFIRSNMYGCDEDDLIMHFERPPSAGQREEDFEELRQARNDVTVSNPWVLAKLNSKTKRHPEEQDEAPAEMLRDDTLVPTRSDGRRQEAGEAMLPTPHPSSPSPPLENHRRTAPAAIMTSTSHGRPIGDVNLPPAQLYMPLPSHNDDDVMGTSMGRPVPQSYEYTLGSQADVPPQGTPVDAIPDVSSRPSWPRKQAQQSRLNKPFVQPFRQQQSPHEKVWFDHLENIDKPRPKRITNRTQFSGGGGLVARGEVDQTPRPLTPPARNRDIRDFIGNTNAIAEMVEHRKLDSEQAGSPARGEHRDMENSRTRQAGVLSGCNGFIPASEIAQLEALATFPSKKPMLSRDPKRRKTSERRALQELSANVPLEGDTPDESRADQAAPTRRTLSRRRSSAKVTRTKSSFLPLESVPAGHSMSSMILPMTLDLGALAKTAFPVEGEPTNVFFDDVLDLQSLGDDLYRVLLEKGAMEGLERQALSSILHAAFVEHGKKMFDRDDGMWDA